MLTRDEMGLLTKVGPEEPLGQMMRRYWIPALLSEELPDRDGKPKPVRLLGEDLVCFRDSSGRVGLLERRCPHRLASLALGRNEEGGLRCLYHGWKFDITGAILDMPCEPPTSRFKEHLRHVAYETREVAGVVWTYMGPPELRPPFPDFAWMDAEASDVWATKFWAKCNWAQGVEGNLDSFHTNVLHSGYEILGYRPETIAELWKRPSRASQGSLFFERTDYGTHYAAVRQASEDAESLEYLRIYEFVSPFFTTLSSDLGEVHGMSAYVPIDDENTMIFGFGAYEPQVRQGRSIFGPQAQDDSAHPRDGATVRERVPTQWVGQFMAKSTDEAFRPLNNEMNNYGQDRTAMSRKDIWYAFTGMAEIGIQDLAMIESMGAVVDRSKEHLGASDFAIASWRDAVVDAVKAFQSGATPPGIDPPAPYREIASVMAVVPIGTDWRSMTWQARRSVPAVGSSADTD